MNVRFLFLYILFFSGCLRMQVDRYWYSPVGSLPEPANYSTNRFKINRETSPEKFTLKISGSTEFWKSYSSGNFIVWRLPIGYNFNFSETTEHCGWCGFSCYEAEEPRGPLKEYLKMYPLAVIWTLGVQIPFTLLDIASLPVRMFPRIETHFDVHQIYGTERIRNIRIGFEKNEKMEKGYVFLENGKEFSLSLKSVYIPNSVFIMYLYSEDGTFSDKRFINIPDNFEKITLIAK